MPKLEIIGPDQQESVHDLSGETVIGRSEDCAVFLLEKKASRRHLALSPAPDGGWLAEDLGSANGTFHGDKRILRRLLEEGDELRIGDTVLRITELAGVASTGGAIKLGGAFATAAAEPEAVAPAEPPPAPEAPPSENGPRPSARPETAPAVTSKVVLALLVGVLAIVGVEFFLGSQAEQGRQEEAANRDARSLVAALEEGTAEDFQGRVDGWLGRYRGVPDRDRFRPFLAYTQARDARRAEVRASLAELLETEKEQQDRALARAGLLELLARAGNDLPFAKEVRGHIRRLDEQRHEIDAAAMDRVAQEVEAAFAARNPGRALRLLSSYRAAYPGLRTATVERVEGLEREATTRMKTIFESTRTQAAALADKDPSGAQRLRLYAALWPRLAGTSYEAELTKQLDALDPRRDIEPTPSEPTPGRSTPSATPTTDQPSTPAPDRRLAEGAIALAEQAEKRLLELDWKQGRELLSAAIAKTPLDGDKQLWQARLASVERVVAYVEAFGQALAAKPRRRKLASGPVTLVAADAAALTLKRGRKQAVTTPWAEVPSEDVLEILTPARPTFEDRIVLASLAADLSLREAMVGFLLPIFERDKATAEVQDLVARRMYGRETVPQGGYRAYKGAIVDEEGYERLLREEEIARLRLEANEVLAAMAKAPVFKKLDKLQALRDELDQRRKYALLAIFNEKHYPYPYRNRPMAVYQAVQGNIDERTAKVREIWDNKLTVKVAMDGASGRRMKEWDALLGKLTEMGQDVRALDKKMRPYRMYLGETLDIRSFYRDPREKALIAYNRWVMEQYNPARTEYATAPERRQTQVTNEYRLMIGYTAEVQPGGATYESITKSNVVQVLDAGKVMRLSPLRAVRVDNRLVESSRLHSLDMSNRGYFSHHAPPNPNTGQPGTSPFQRIAAAGYVGWGSSENICMGATAPESAHARWIHSSGHHRNILSPWTDMGAGLAGRYWTQNFGTGGGGPAQVESDTGIRTKKAPR